MSINLFSMPQLSQPLYLDVAYQERTGERHKTNEDHADYEVIQQDLMRGVFAVADGMGGLARADKASKQAVQAFVNHILRSSSWRNGMVEKIQDGFIKANQAVRSLREDEKEEVGTTLSVALINQEQLYLGGLGDSRIYRWRKGELQQLTHDHTLTQERIQRGELAPEKAEDDPDRNKLTHYLGRCEQLNPYRLEIKSLDIQAGDIIFLVTDGVTEYIHDEALSQLAKKLQKPKRVIEEVIKRVKERHGHDDATIIAIRVGTYEGWRRFLTVILLLMALLPILLNSVPYLY